MAPTRLLVASPKHIRIVTYDAGAAKLEVAKDFEVPSDPSWLQFIGPDLVYAIDEGSSTMRVYKLRGDNPADMTLEEVVSQQGSSGVCHIEFNKDNTRMLSAAYGNGTIDVWDTSSGGLKLMKTLHPKGENGPNPNRQEQSHPHQIVLDPSGRFWIVNDLGFDSLWVIDGKDDKFEIVEGLKVDHPGAGPRHGAFYSATKGSDQATHYVLLCEMGNLVVLYSLEYTDNKVSFTHVQSVSTFDPNNPPATQDKACASELVLLGNEVFASNRITGERNDSIAHLRLVPAISGSEVSVQYVEQVDCGGTWPRNISVTPDGRTMFIGNQQGEPSGLVVLSLGKDGKFGEQLAAIPQTVWGSPDAKQGPWFVNEF